MVCGAHNPKALGGVNEWALIGKDKRQKKASQDGYRCE